MASKPKYRLPIAIGVLFAALGVGLLVWGQSMARQTPAGYSVSAEFLPRIMQVAGGLIGLATVPLVVGLIMRARQRNNGE